MAAGEAWASMWMPEMLAGSLFLSVAGAGQVWRPGVGWPEVVPDAAVRALERESLSWYDKH